MKQMLHLRKKGLKRAVLLILLAVLHCNNTALYDEALTRYYRVVRPGLNEWYPLNGNLSSRIGSADGSATGVYTAGINRAGESGKAVCVTASEINFASANFRTNPGTVSAWLKFNTTASGSLFQNGDASTFYIGFRFRQTGLPGIEATYGSGGGGGTSPVTSVTTGIWYYLAFSYGNGRANFYIAPYGGNLTNVFSSSGPYAPSAFPLRFFNAVAADACIDDLVSYGRELSADEVRENFLTLE
jgi:hypothetical protein